MAQIPANSGGLAAEGGHMTNYRGGSITRSHLLHQLCFILDLAAGIVAKTDAKSRAATVAIEALSFKRPVSVGDIVCIYCDLYQVGTTSMKIHVEVWSRKPEVSQREKVTEGTFVFVAIDEEGRTKAIES